LAAALGLDSRLAIVTPAQAQKTPDPEQRLLQNSINQRRSPMKQFQNGNRLVLALVGSLMSAVPSAILGSPVALAVDTISSKDAPDLAAVRAKIKVKDYQGALSELRTLADTTQHADVYSLLGFSLHKTGDYTNALTFYRKALDFDAEHKAAHEYLGELYLETGQLQNDREQLAALEKLCPQGL
jgi:Flp pilus assembly protein TadD